MEMVFLVAKRSLDSWIAVVGSLWSDVEVVVVGLTFLLF